MADKRENVFGLTPLPGGGYAEYVWDELSPKMREGLSFAGDFPERWMFSNHSTLAALRRRGLLNQINRLTESGKDLLEWMKNNERNA